MRYFLLFLLIFLTIPAFSQFDPVINVGLGSIGYGGNFPLNNDYNTEGYFSLFNVGIEDRYTGIGVGFTPLAFFGWSVYDEGDAYDFSATSLINLSLYWNVLGYRSKDFGSNFYLGPFVSLNYAFAEDIFYWDRYIFTAGIHLGFRYRLGSFNNRLNYDIFSFEMGYRNIDGVSKYYIGGKVDIAVFIGFIAVLVGGSANRQIEERYEW